MILSVIFKKRKLNSFLFEFRKECSFLNSATHLTTYSLYSRELKRSLLLLIVYFQSWLYICEFPHSKKQFYQNCLTFLLNYNVTRFKNLFKFSWSNKPIGSMRPHNRRLIRRTCSMSISTLLKFPESIAMKEIQFREFILLCGKVNEGTLEIPLPR